ncbi:hypothetical protein C6341_g22854 [Phytophthora cactorum]|nr:hypothetical protein C6341_g22854 [Phytophthora cactorum]
MEVVDLVELESVRSDELEKAKAVAGSHAPTTEVVSMFEMFEALLGWDEHDHALRTKTLTIHDELARKHSRPHERIAATRHT